MSKTLFLWDVKPELKTYFRKHLSSKVKPVLIEPFNKEKIPEVIQDANVIVGWRPKKEWLTAAASLKFHINPGAGVQHLIPEFSPIYKEQGITLINSHGNAYNTAQHAFALLTSLCNGVLFHHVWMKNGEWRIGDDRYPSYQIKNMNIGLLGFGHVNQYLCSFLRPFNPKISVLNRSGVKAIEKDRFPDDINWFTESNEAEFYSKIDCLIIAIPSTSKSKHLIKKEHFEKMKEQLLLVNIGRGDLIEEALLFDMLHNKKIKAAAIDVWYNYKPEKDKNGLQYPYKHPFHELDNVVLSPHRAASPFADLSRWEDVVENLNQIAENRVPFKNVVDLDLGY